MYITYNYLDLGGCRISPLTRFRQFITRCASETNNSEKSENDTIVTNIINAKAKRWQFRSTH